MGNRRLRETQLKKEGWHWNEDDGIPSVFHLDKRIKITVCNTDEGTGLLNQVPQQTSKKGSATERNITGNQLSLFANENYRPAPLPNIIQPGRITCWYLCVFCDPDSEVVRAEVSLPVLSEDGLFTAFHARIVLTNPGGDGDGAKLRKLGPDGTGDFEISVIRKKVS